VHHGQHSSVSDADHVQPRDDAGHGEAYDHATKTLHGSGQHTVVQQVIANRIVDLAGSGERDPPKLAGMALQSLGIAS
jgi:hypothetical protein